MIKPYYETELGKLYHGDCLEILPQLTEKVDLVLTSPPYDNLRDYKGFSFDFEGVVNGLSTAIVDGGIIVWIVSDATIKGSETGTSFKQALYFKEIGLNLHDTMIYGKNGFAFPEATRYQPIFEYMFVFSKGKPKSFNPLKRKNKYGGIVKREFERKKDGTIQNEKDRYYLEEGNYGNIWMFDIGYMHSSKDPIAYQHPAIFPDKLAQDHIRSWSNPGDIVLDPFLGSGTTAVACERLGRRWIGVEISGEYCKIPVKRIEQERAQLKLCL